MCLSLSINPYGSGKSSQKIVKLIKKSHLETGIKTYAIVHCQNPELAKEYKDIFTEIIGFEPSYTTEISSATAIHSGLGSVAVGYITK